MSLLPANDVASATKILDGLACTRGGCLCQTSRKRGHGLTHCPSHQDAKSSLNVSVVSGTVLLRCHAGCKQEDVIAVLRERRLWPEIKAIAIQAPIAYDYRNADGKLVYQVVRKPDKKFSQRHPDGNGGWVWNLTGTERVLYRLPELMADTNRAVFITEGEKDANRLASLGLIATCNSGGAGKWQTESAEILRDRTVYILPDNDQPGQEHGQAVAASLHGVAREVRIVELPGLPEKGDVSDWLDAGHILDELKALVKHTPVWTPVMQRITQTQASHSASTAGVMQAGRARLYDLGGYRADDDAAGTDWLIDSWLVRGEVHLTVAPEKLGKTTQQWWRIEAISRGSDYHGAAARAGRALVVTEMGPDGIRSLLADDGIEPDFRQVKVMFLDEIPPEERLPQIGDAIAEWRPDYLCLDPIDECFGLDERGIFNPALSGQAFDQLRQWARLGITIEGLYHVNNQGNVANSYKFRSKPDHLYRVRGTDPGDVTIEYRGRLRAIPRKRRLHGSGEDGYQVSVLATAPMGRPAKTRQLIREYLVQMITPQSVSDVAKGTGLKWDATKKGLERGCKAGDFRHLDGAGYSLLESDESPQYTSDHSFVPTGQNLEIRTDETLSLVKEPTFVRSGITDSEPCEICPVCDHLMIPSAKGVVCPHCNPALV
jgi:AAA domain-containing protein